MKALKNVKMRWKLFALSLPLVIAIIVSVILTGLKIKNTEAEVTSVYYDMLYKVNNHLVSAQSDLYRTLNGATYYYNYHGTSGMFESMVTTNLNEYKNGRQSLIDNVEAAAAIASTNENLYRGITCEEGETFEEAYQAFLESFERWDGQYDIEADQGSWFHYQTTFQTAKRHMNNMMEITEAWADSEHEALMARNAAAIVSYSIVYAIVIVVLILLVFLILRQINSSIKEVTTSLDELSNGNLRYSFPDENNMGKDEIGQIHRAAKNLSVKLDEIIGRTKEMSEHINVAGTDLAESANQATQASEQVLQAVDEVSQGAIGQAESVEVAAGNTKDIESDIGHITSIIHALAEKTETMKDKCNETMETMRGLLAQNEEVVNNMQAIHSQISATNDAVRNIADASKIITDISSQTNLLSLNASIEAARAGEAGRGFAVVAEEIGNLADQSGNAAVQISKIVKELVDESAKSVATIEEMNEGFEKQNKQIGLTGKDVQDMVNEVNEIADQTQEITSQIKSLLDSKESLVGIINELSAVSEENAASTEETNAAMQELNATFSLIGESAEQLQKLAEELKENISFFND
jgi:methyl-accepting chemotaxis protein